MRKVSRDSHLAKRNGLIRNRTMKSLALKEAFKDIRTVECADNFRKEWTNNSVKSPHLTYKIRHMRNKLAPSGLSTMSLQVTDQQ